MNMVPSKKSKEKILLPILVGQDQNIPPGCSWTNKLSMVGKPMAFWNKSEQGSSRYDLNPLCQTSPKQNYNDIDYIIYNI